MEIISLKCDVCLKELFRNEEVLKYFLSDVLDIPIEKIRRVRLMNTHLFRRYRKEKLGIVDVLAELNDDTRINIEVQIKTSREWDKRQLFYLSKIYVADLGAGQEYGELKRCVGISVLDFNLTDREEYHSVYRLRDAEGHEFSDMLEIHTLELKKKLPGKDSLEDWIRLFNAESEADLDMIRTENRGIRQAIRELRRMSLSKSVRALYEERLKERRDRWAIEAYMKEEAQRVGLETGMQQGIERGMQQGIEQGIDTAKKVLKLSAQGMPDAEIAARLDISLELVHKITN